MFQFNPDGSLKLPDSMAKKLIEDEQKMKSLRCIKIEREVISFTSPKKCMLHLTLSDAYPKGDFVQNIFRQMQDQITVPCKINKLSEKEFDIEIGTDFRRCTDCQKMRGEYRAFADGNFIDKKGTCTFNGQINNFSYEDYFD